MFGIILSILKIIGIILLILLALVLFVLCIVLFVPIRYKADGFYKESYKIEARVTWLLHIVTLRVCQSSEEALHVMLKILGLTVYDNTRPKADKKQKNKAKAAKKKKEKNNNEEKKKSYEITIDFIKSGSSIKEVAKERKLTLVTVMSHIQQYIAEGNKIDFEIHLEEFFNNDEEKIVLNAIDKVGYNKLKDIKEVVPEEITYDAIRAVVLKKIISYN